MRGWARDGSVARRGRPPSARAAQAMVVHVKLRLYPGEDDDLIAFVSRVPRGLLAASVKRALRDGRQTDAPAVEDDALFSVLGGLVD